jgi:hypothetical protein
MPSPKAVAIAVLSLGLLPSRGAAAICQAEQTFQGPPGIPGERFAGVVALPDVTGDGIKDIAIRASQSLMVFSGADRSVHCRIDLPTGQSFEDVAPIGDLNGDGITEIAAGYRGGGAGLGSVLIVSGADCSAIRSCPAPSEQGLLNGLPVTITYGGLGSSVAAAGDLTGDGKPDVLAAVVFTSVPTLPPQNGRIVVFSGADCSVWAKSATTGQLPRTLGLPDLTGDGKGEIAVSTTGGTGIAAVSIYSGADLSLVRTLSDPGASPEDGFAQTLTLVPDLTGDGVPELAAGEPGSLNTTNGAFVLFSLTDGALLRKCRDPQGRANDGLGTTLAGVANAYGDGRTMIAAGVPGRDGSATNSGEVQIYDAATCDLVQRLSDASSSASAGLGKSVAGLGDVNGDGLQHLITAEVSYDPSGPAQQLGVLFALDPACLACGSADRDDDGVPDCSDNCPGVANPDQADCDQNGIGDACETCGVLPPGVAPSCACDPGTVVNAFLEIHPAAGKGSGLVTWRSTKEAVVAGFNIVTVDRRDPSVRVVLNPALIPCRQCSTHLGASYDYLLPKHKSGRDLYIEIVDVAGNHWLAAPVAKD